MFQTEQVSQSIQETFPTKVAGSRDQPSYRAQKSYQTKSSFLEKPKVLYIGDSNQRNVNFANAETVTKTRIKTEKAYSSAHNIRAKMPLDNFAKITPQALKNTRDDDPFTHLVLSAPSVDISNLETSKLTQKDNIEDLQHEVLSSCQNMFITAESALKNFPNLKKVVILKHGERFDPPHIDPCGVKSELANFANATFDQLLFTSPFKQRIQIGSRNLDIVSIIDIVRNFRTETIQAKQAKQDDCHLNCPQSQYQKMKKRTYSQVVLENPPIKTFNRFSPLGN